MTIEHEAKACYLPCEENLHFLARAHCEICGKRTTLDGTGSPIHRPDVEGGAGPVRHGKAAHG